MDKKTLFNVALVFGAYLLITVLMFWPLFQNIANKLPGGFGGDTAQSAWDLWWVGYSLFTLHTSPYFTNFIYYPVGANLVTQTLAPLAGIISVPFQAVSLAFALNVIFLLGFVLSGLFMYLLAHHITKNKYASFIAGFIYAFSPMHTIQSFGHLQFTNIEFIPLFLLFFLQMLEDKKHRSALFAAVSFIFITFMGDIEQALITILLVFFVLVYLLITKSNRSRVLNKRFLMLFAEMLVAILVIGSPAFLAILGSINKATLNTVNSQANINYNILYSPDLLSFLIPSSMNGPLGFASNAFASINAPAAAERTTYIGYTVLLLSLVAILSDFKDRFRNTGIIIVPLIFFILLSIGPYLQVNGSLFEITNGTRVPGLYLLYHQIPFFNVLREPGRFDIAIELFLALLAAIGFAKIESRLFSKTPNKKVYLAAVFMVLLFIEYNSWPLSQTSLNRMYADVQIPNVYSEMTQVPGNFSVLVLPALTNFVSASPNLYPGMALYYQTVFKKPLVGGYATRSNTSQMFSMINVPLIVSSFYLEAGQGLVYGSPIVENYTNTTLILLGAYNVRYVAVIRQAYNQTQLGLLASYLADVFGYPVYQDNTTLVFSTYNAISASAGKSVVAYSPVLIDSAFSLWQPGWVLCGSSPCPPGVANTWFSTDPAYINIYSPGYHRMNISMGAMAYQEFKPVYVYFNDLSQPAFILNLTPSIRNYTLTVGLTPGLNLLVFHSLNNTAGSYSNIGISNITFKTYS